MSWRDTCPARSHLPLGISVASSFHPYLAAAVWSKQSISSSFSNFFNNQQHTWLGVQAICRNFVNQLLITLKKANTATFKECLIVKLEKMKEVPSEFLNLGTSFGCSFKNNDWFKRYIFSEMGMVCDPELPCTFSQSTHGLPSHNFVCLQIQRTDFNVQLPWMNRLQSPQSWCVIARAYTSAPGYSVQVRTYPIAIWVNSNDIGSHIDYELPCRPLALIVSLYVTNQVFADT